MGICACGQHQQYKETICEYGAADGTNENPQVEQSQTEESQVEEPQVGEPGTKNLTVYSCLRYSVNHGMGR